MRNPHRQRGKVMIEAAVVAALIVVVIAILLPMLHESRRDRRGLAQNTQSRGIHQGFVTYAQSNRRGGNDGFFPGLDAAGQLVPDGPLTGNSGDGAVPGARLWMMMDQNYFTPEYVINPADSIAEEVGVAPRAAQYQPVAPNNHSYALLALAKPDGREAEWSETLNPDAIVLSDRARGTGPADISSVRTDLGGGQWEGAVVRNDNSTRIETTHTFADLRFGEHPSNLTDDLFEDDPTTADAFLVHDDATTAYSAR